MGEDSKYKPENPRLRKRRLEIARTTLVAEMIADLASSLDSSNLERHVDYNFKREFPNSSRRDWRAYVYKREGRPGFDIREDEANLRTAPVESVLVEVKSSDRFYEGGVLDIKLHDPKLRPDVEQFVQYYWGRLEKAGATDFTIGVVEAEKPKE